MTPYDIYDTNENSVMNKFPGYTGICFDSIEHQNLLKICSNDVQAITVHCRTTFRILARRKKSKNRQFDWMSGLVLSDSDNITNWFPWLFMPMEPGDIIVAMFREFINLPCKYRPHWIDHKAIGCVNYPNKENHYWGTSWEWKEERPTQRDPDIALFNSGLVGAIYLKPTIANPLA